MQGEGECGDRPPSQLQGYGVAAGAVVEYHGLVVGDRGGDAGGQPGLLPEAFTVADLEGQWGTPLHGADRTAVGAAQQTGGLELDQVTPDGDGRHPGHSVRLATEIICPGANARMIILVRSGPGPPTDAPDRSRALPSRTRIGYRVCPARGSATDVPLDSIVDRL